ncbi:MAG TPA: ATP synthase F0 subunit B [Planktothrix sp.]|jgi:F-type H+-transporting ATPase subunit b
MEAEQFSAIAAVVDWVLLLVLLGWLVTKHVPPVLAARKERIELSLKDAQEAKSQGEKFLADQRALVANQEQETKRIIDDAKNLAVQLEQDAKVQTQKEIADLEKKIQSSIDTERQLAITQLRGAAARASLKLTEELLPSLMTADVRVQLLTQFMEQLDEVADEQGPKISAGHLESIH